MLLSVAVVIRVRGIFPCAGSGRSWVWTSTLLPDLSAWGVSNGSVWTPLCRNRSDRCRMPHIRDELPVRKAFHRRSLCQCCGVKHLVLLFRGWTWYVRLRFDSWWCHKRPLIINELVVFYSTIPLRVTTIENHRRSIKSTQSEIKVTTPTLTRWNIAHYACHDRRMSFIMIA